MQQQPRPLSDCIADYVDAVSAEDFARADRGILSALTQFKSAWEAAHSDDTVGALYQGYMDMSFVAVLPSSLAQRRLKISLVFLHERCFFAVVHCGQPRHPEARFRRAEARAAGQIYPLYAGAGRGRDHRA